MKNINKDGETTKKRHGYGTSTWSKPFGGEYVGDWENDKYHGEGKYVFNNGDSWHGSFEKGKANGYGCYVLNGINIEDYKIDNKLHGFA